MPIVKPTRVNQMMIGVMPSPSAQLMPLLGFRVSWIRRYHSQVPRKPYLTPCADTSDIQPAALASVGDCNLSSDTFHFTRRGGLVLVLRLLRHCWPSRFRLPE